MKFIAVLTSLLISTAAALPAVRRADEPPTFQLKTTNSPNPAFNNLFVSTYHTGAGTSAAVFGGSDVGMRFYLNGTSLIAPSASNFVWAPGPASDDIYQGMFPPPPKKKKKKKKKKLFIGD